MTDTGDSSGTELTDAAADSAATPAFEEGRYVFCAVSVGDDDGGDAADGERAAFSAEGIDGGSVSLVCSGGIGAVVQPVESVFDSSDPTQVQRWLLSHQQVVDDAGRAFGTPLPFRFDTILEGDDRTVVEWLDDHESALEDALAWLSGRWEYRIELRWDESQIAEAVREDDDELRELSVRVEDAPEGTSFLLEKQYDQRLDDRLADRRQHLAAELRGRIEPHAVELQRSDGRSGALSTGGDTEGKTDGEAGSEADGEAGSEADGETELSPVVGLTVLADADHEERIGEELEPFADRPRYDVRYTGPWPPYSFAPAIGTEGTRE